MACNKTKTDEVLGLAVRNHLISLGLETPIIEKNLEVKDDKKIKNITKHMTAVMEELGLDLTDDSLIDTPARVAKMYVMEKFWGLKYENFPECTTISNKMKYDEVVLERGISVLSDCEHHLVQIDGLATVAYIPKERVLGLSKMNRIVEYFSRRPQVQERLTQQIAETLKFILGTDDVAVMIRAKHYCVISRGVEDHNSETITSFISGGFKDNKELRSEFMSIANAVC
jgi:GTP cyclohydrolase IA